VPSPAEVVDSYAHDPMDPVPTSGGRHLGYGYGRAGVMNQAAIEDRADVLCFTGELLSEPWDVVGSVRVELFVTSSAEGADFCAKLVDVRPDGYCANVVEGVRRVSMEQGTLSSDPVAVVIDLWPTAYRFEAGHRMRLEVASSNFPKYDRNGGLTGSPSGTRASDWVRAVQHVHSGPRHPSVLWLGGSGRGSA
jgi:putative CocE/NonD family hydrolase